MKLTRRQAYTLVEVAIGLAVGVAVLGIVIGLLTFTTRAMTRTEERLGPRESATLALTTLRLGLADAIVYAITDSGTRVAFSTTKKSAEIAYDGSQLRYRPPGQKSFQVLLGHVKACLFEEVRSGFLRLSLEVERPPTAGMSGLPPLRMADEVLIPARLAADPAYPWQPALEYAPPKAASAGK